MKRLRLIMGLAEFLSGTATTTVLYAGAPHTDGYGLSQASSKYSFSSFVKLHIHRIET